MKAIRACYLAILACATASSASLAQSPNEERYRMEGPVDAPPAMPGDRGGCLNGSQDRKDGGRSCGGGAGGGFGGPTGHGGPGGHGGRGGPGGGPDMAFMKSLQLTDAQREQLHAIHQQEHRAGATRQAEIMKLQHQLMDGVFSGNLEKSRARALQTQINALESVGRNEHVASMVDNNVIFTPEQRKLMRQHMLEQEPGMQGGPMGGPAMGGRQLGGPGSREL